MSAARGSATPSLAHLPASALKNHRSSSGGLLLSGEPGQHTGTQQLCACACVRACARARVCVPVFLPTRTQAKACTAPTAGVPRLSNDHVQLCGRVCVSLPCFIMDHTANSSVHRKSTCTHWLSILTGMVLRAPIG